MKYKKKLKNLQARLKWWDNLPKSIQGAYCRPGSEKK